MVIKKILQGLKKSADMTYERAKELARHEDATVRLELAAREDVRPEILYYLADDADPSVRRAIAANTATPRQADLKLVADEDQEVRVGLAEKIALLAPGLSADEQDAIRELTYEALEILARDQFTKVRQILSETLKDVADAPPEVILQLARDVELVVCGPVLEFSPVLSAEDILEIIKSDPVMGSLGAVARRQDLGEAVTDAIASSEDQGAIAELLGNKSAQIREETLNSLIDRAVDIEPWHEPLVHRPQLPKGAAGRLARFVAENLLDLLTARKDLDPEMAEEVKTIVNRRLEEDQPPEELDDVEQIPPHVMKEVRELGQMGQLDGDRLNDALQSGNKDFAAAALTVLTGLDEKIIMRGISMRSAKAMVAFAAEADFEPWLAEQLQLRLCKIPREDVMMPPAGQDYALSDEEVAWQINFLKDLSS